MTGAIGTLEVHGATVSVDEREAATLPGLDVRAFALIGPVGYDALLVLGRGLTALVQGRAYVGAVRVRDGGATLLRDHVGKQSFVQFRARAHEVTARQAGVHRCSLCRTGLCADAKVTTCTRCRGALCAACRPAGAQCIRCGAEQGGMR